MHTFLQNKQLISRIHYKYAISFIISASKKNNEQRFFVVL